MRKTSSALKEQAPMQLALLDLPPATPGAAGAPRRRDDPSRRALQAASNARQCEALLAALERVSGPMAGAPAPPSSASSLQTRGPRTFGGAAAEARVHQLASLFEAVERACDTPATSPAGSPAAPTAGPRARVPGWR